MESGVWHSFGHIFGTRDICSNLPGRAVPREGYQYPQPTASFYELTCVGYNHYPEWGHWPLTPGTNSVICLYPKRHCRKDTLAPKFSEGGQSKSATVLSPMITGYQQVRISGPLTRSYRRWIHPNTSDGWCSLMTVTGPPFSGTSIESEGNGEGSPNCLYRREVILGPLGGSMWRWSSLSWFSDRSHGS